MFLLFLSSFSFFSIPWVFAIDNANAVAVLQCGQTIPSTASSKAAWSVVIELTSSACQENQMTPALAPVSPKLISSNSFFVNDRSCSKPGPYQFTEPDPSSNTSMSNCAVQTRSCGHSMVLQYAVCIRASSDQSGQ